MGCQSSAPAPLILKTKLLKTSHPSLNSIIEQAEHSLRELARICNPLEVAIDRFFSIYGRKIDEGFRECLMALVVAVQANCKEGEFVFVRSPNGFKVKTQSWSEHLQAEYEAWCELALELQYTITDLSENLLMLMDCASTSHRLNLALVHLIRVEELRVVDIRKVMVVLDKNEETIRTAAELLHVNVRRAKAYSSESEQVLQWLKQAESLHLLSQEVAAARERRLRSASEVLAQRTAAITEVSALSAGK